MTNDFYGEAVETLEILVSSLGAGLAAWGVINLLESYDTTESDKIAEGYRSRLNEIDLRLQRLFEDKATGKITPAQYKEICAVYDAEQDELWIALHRLERETEVRKQQGVAQIMQGARFAATAPAFRDTAMFPDAENLNCQ